MLVNNEQKLQLLEEKVREKYLDCSHQLWFHDWRHIQFVRKKAKIFALTLRADTFLVSSASLVHDLNYFSDLNEIPEAGTELRKKVLLESLYESSQISHIEKIVIEGHTSYRKKSNAISIEAQALSDADTLYKALPITPILFAHKYIEENRITLDQLAQKIIIEQTHLMENGIYFYSDLAKSLYMKWAKTNLDLWNNVLDSLDDGDVIDLIREKEVGRETRNESH